MNKEAPISLNKSKPLDFGCPHLNQIAGHYYSQAIEMANAHEEGKPEPIFQLVPLPPCIESNC